MASAIAMAMRLCETSEIGAASAIVRTGGSGSLAAVAIGCSTAGVLF
jgi:hypothetical protein